MVLVLPSQIMAFENPCLRSAISYESLQGATRKATCVARTRRQTYGLLCNSCIGFVVSIFGGHNFPSLHAGHLTSSLNNLTVTTLFLFKHLVARWLIMLVY